MKSILVVIMLAFVTTANLTGQAEYFSLRAFKSCEFKATGRIAIAVDQEWAEDYPGNYSLKWENITTGEYEQIYVPFISSSYPTISLEDMSAGEYEIFIEYEDDCWVFLTAEILEIETKELQGYISTVDPNCGASDGEIFVTAVGAPSPFLFVWSIGVIESGSISHLTELDAGGYGVTISSADCGLVEEVIELRDPITPYVIEVIIDNLSNCDNAGNSASNDGSIQLQIVSDNMVNVVWNGPNGFGSSGSTEETGIQYGHSVYTNTLSDLSSSGTYTYVIEYGENCTTAEFSVELECCDDFTDALDVQIDGSWDCLEETGVISVEISDGWEPYEINWSTGETTSAIEVNTANAYSVTVEDARGCEVELIYDYEIVEIIEQNAACEGIYDGSIIFRVNNPNNYPVDIQYDFSPCQDCSQFPLITDETDDPITIELNDLQGNVQYTFHIHIDGCYIPFTFTLDEEPFEQQYDGYFKEDGIYYCRYDLDCGETFIEDGEISIATIDINEEECDPGNPFSGCGSVDYYCNDNSEPIASKNIHRKMMRRLEAVILARQLGFSEDVISFHLQGEACDRLTVCPNNPICGSVAFLGEFGGQFAGYTTLPNGCKRVRCRLFGIFGFFNYTICGLDFIPDYIRPYIDDDPDFLERCEQVEKEVSALVYNLPGMIATFGTEFTESTLYDFLITNQNNPARNCARVTYCANDFRYLESDIGDVVCEILDPPHPLGGNYYVGATCIPEPYTSETEGIYVWCYRDCGNGIRDCFEPRFISFHPSCCTLTSGDTIIPPLFIHSMTSNTTFKSFAPLIQEEGGLTMNGILRQGDTTRYHIFSVQRNRSVVVDSLVYLFQNPTENSIYLVEKDTSENPTYKVFYGDLSEPNELSFSSDDLLTVETIYSHSTKHIIQGKFKGDLNYANNTVETSTIEQDYIFQTSHSGTLLGSHKILASGATKFVSDQFSGLFYSINSQNATLSLNGGTSAIYSVGDVVEIAVSDLAITGTKRMSIGSDFQMLRFAYDSITNSKFYLLNGRGIVSIGSQQVYSGSQSKLVLIATENNNFSWSETFDNSVVRTDYISVEASENGSVYLGFNLLDSLIIGDSTYSSVGGSDVLLMGFNSSGDIFYTHQSGSEDDELLKDIFYSGDLLFLGGDLLGPTSTRQIGSLEFHKFAEEQDHGFISVAVVDSAYLGQVALSTGVEDQEEPAFESNVSLLYPNPARDRIFIRQMLNKQLVEVEIYDAYGRLMSTIMNLDLQDGPTELDISGFVSGIYFVRWTDSRGLHGSSSFIKTE